MTATFDRALAYTLRFEGGFSNDPDDSGGATKYGVSLRFLRSLGEIERWDHDGDGDLDVDDIRALTAEQSGELLHAAFWAPVLEGIEDTLAIKLFDFAVNVGPRQRTKFLQRALNQDDGVKMRLIVDGILGPRTGEALMQAREPYLPDDIEDHAARFYFDLAERRRASRKYLFGWLRRCYARPEL